MSHRGRRPNFVFGVYWYLYVVISPVILYSELYTYDTTAMILQAKTSFEFYSMLSQGLDHCLNILQSTSLTLNIEQQI